ncbi:sugar phosphate isomerase/epimerase [Microbacterium sp. G2-8]|uniref:sugar phosphate isomerase/epimerase family protein n=1 Tax=Microbacterium sp. G2-8 TaxID=2842454 RepID=UPI001C8ABAAC|nr:TIM barrel protein [Microbacterium sp. G2-8]
MIGLGTYAFFWEMSDRASRPLSLIGALETTRDLDVGLFQICDFAPLESMTDAELHDAARAARELGLEIEIGTKGLEPDHLARFLRIAEIFDARLVRSMLRGAAGSPSLADARHWVTQAVPSYEAAGVDLALETYEQVATRDLVTLVEQVGSDALGICLDPANVVARLENPRDCVETAAPLVKNVHVKDFAFAREPGWVGFTYSGAPMGDGLHDYAHLLDTVDPRGRGINEIVEHWLPWQSDERATIDREREWTRRSLNHLRRTP